MDLTQTWYAAAASAWGCYLFGIWTYRLSRGEPLFVNVAKAALVACPVILSCFGIHATRQYQVILAVHKLPLVEVANSDNGRERIIERIDVGHGIAVEREHIPGWHFVSANRRGHEANRSVLQRTAGREGCGACSAGCSGECEGCECPILGLPGCCNGAGFDCICNQLEIAGNGRQF